MPSGAGSFGLDECTAPDEGIADGTDGFTDEVEGALGADETRPDFAAEIPMSQVMSLCRSTIVDRPDWAVLNHQAPSAKNMTEVTAAIGLNIWRGGRLPAFFKRRSAFMIAFQYLQKGTLLLFR